MKAWLAAAALFGTPATWTGAAAAAPHSRAALHVENGSDTADCADAASLAKAVEARLGRSVFDGSPQPDLRVHVKFARVRPRLFRAELRLADSTGHELGQREIVVPSAHCSALDASLALVIALLVDSAPSPAASTPTPSTSPTAPAAPTPSNADHEPAPTATPIALPADTPAPREPWWFGATLSGVAALGLLPGTALGVSVGFGVRPPHFRELWVSVDAFPARSPSAAAGAELSSLRFGLSVCPLELEFGRVGLRACGGQRVGFVRAQGVGFDMNQATRELAYDLEAGVAAAVRLAGPVAVRFGLAANLPLVRDAYIARTPGGGRRELFQASPVAGTARVGLGVEL